MNEGAARGASGNPEPGDVIFVYSGDKEGLGSCLLQRLIFDRPLGPWFSHVALVVSSSVVLEANTAPEAGERTWSGAVLGEGVRLRLLPDLFEASSSTMAVRHPTATDLALEFGTQTPRIALLLGSGYSTRALIEAAKRASWIVGTLVSESAFDWRAAPDVIARTLRDDPDLRDGIARHLRAGETLSVEAEYFCSQLAGVLLWRGGLIPQDPGTITPCGLFDLLSSAGWQDVTEPAYGAATHGYWQRVPRGDWQVLFEAAVGEARYFRESEHVVAMLGHVGDKVDDFSARLDVVRQRLDDMRGA